MKFTALFLLISIGCLAQDHGFPFGQVTFEELNIKTYSKDTVAVAVVLNEFGEAYIENDNNYNLLFEYHVKIKILRKEGLSMSNIEVPLYMQDGKKETIRSIKASSFNLNNSGIQETKSGKFFIENSNKYWNIEKMAIANVQVGSVIEIQYVLESPFIYKFRPWEFQDDIPKIKSEYWARVPGNYVYNMTLKGPLKLSKNQSEIVRDCLDIPGGGGGKSECALYKYAMSDIPAFIEEDYMTAKSNFLSAINYELSEVKYFDGHIDRVTKEWKDADEELKRHEGFGQQLKKGKDIIDKKIDVSDNDQLVKAKKIYEFVRGWYTWDGEYSKYSSDGIKKAFDKKKGNVGDINLSLLAALRYSGLRVEPVILSTRENGLPIELHPVLSDFNYVIAKLIIDDKTFLLDATDDYLPFGALPMRCMNGKGRAIAETGSYWIDLIPLEKSKKKSISTLKIGNDGKVKGVIQSEYFGYEALQKRKQIGSFTSRAEYLTDLRTKVGKLNIVNHEAREVDDLSKPLIENLEFEINEFEKLESTFLFNPFVIGKTQSNPFKSDQRSYPIDFGTSFDEIIEISLEFPEEYEINSLPEQVNILLPRGGGRYVFVVTKTDTNKIRLINSLNILKPIYPSTDYKALKNLYSGIIQAQNTDLIFTKK